MYMYFLLNNNGLLIWTAADLYWKKENFYLMGAPQLNGDGIEMKFSVQSIMVKSCEPDSLASTQSDRRLGIQPLWVSRLKGRAESPLHFSIFMISSLTLLMTDIRLTSIFSSYIDMIQWMGQYSSSLLHRVVLLQPLEFIVLPNTVLWIIFIILLWNAD